MTGYYEAEATTCTWYAWNNTATTACNAVTVWQEWTSAGTACTTSDTAITWTQWVGTSGYKAYRAPAPRQLTEAEIQANAEREAAYAEDCRKQSEARKKAERTARKLFVSLIGRDAHKAFRKRGYHELIGISGKRYRLKSGQRVTEMDGNFGDKAKAYLCIYSEGGLPAMDQLVMQVLLIQAGKEGEKILHDTAIRTAA